VLPPWLVDVEDDPDPDALPDMYVVSVWLQLFVVEEVELPHAEAEPHDDVDTDPLDAITAVQPPFSRSNANGV
jgi:hypothetical protein